MTDIFENKIMCNRCNKPMKKVLVNKEGFNLRAVACDKCNEKIFHPVDFQEYENFLKLKNKEFEVKMRMVGNSYAVSIPREIVNFMKEQENMIDNMVKLCFEDTGRISLNFNNLDDNREDIRQDKTENRVIRAREVSVIKNNKPVFHAKQFSDSANPHNNKTKIFKLSDKNKLEEDSEEE
jgi:hypothetical protein